jgi:hypothetical protein
MVTGGCGRAPDPASVIVGRGWDVFGRRRRRRARRERAGWLGRYAPVESPGRDWSRCRVLDVSTGGAGLDLLGADARVGDRFVLDVQLVRSTVACVTLTGEVRDVARLPHGHGTDGVRVGVRFVDVGELELALLQRLVARQKHERRHADVVIPLTTSRAWE